MHDIIKETANFFGKDSPLQKAAKHGGRIYEERPQQKEIAIGIAESFLSSANLCIEAPTGVGKSIAYLVPSIFYSLKTNMPVIVSTETINLQEQLVNKDLPLLKKLIDFNFTYAIAKGRSNYICKRRLNFALSRHSKDYRSENVTLPEILKIKKQIDSTYDGSKDNLGFIPSHYLWKSICCEFNNCMNTKCKYYSSCFHKAAFNSWKIVNIVVTNHSMFFSDIKKRMSNNTCLFQNFSALVIDEAHSLEHQAAKHLGSEISELNIYDFLKKLYNPFTSRGLLTIEPNDVTSLMDKIVSALDEVKTFFNILRAFIEEVGQSSRIIDEHIVFNNTLFTMLSEIDKELFEYIRRHENEELKLELNNQRGICNEFINILSNAFDMTDNSVYWGEIKKVSGNDSVLFKYAPLNIAEILDKYMFNEYYSVILTSATLAVGNGLNYYKNRVGFTGNDKVLSSPFDYEKNVTIYIDPQNKNTDSLLARKIEKYVNITSGKALVLFTSYGALRKAKENTSDFFKNKDIRLFVQGEELNRTDMIEAFKSDKNSVLFGTSSFWTGVDVPGEALCNVIITKLPFPVPTEPLVKARCDIIEKEKGNPFEEYILPESIIKFKQGFGRLIRSKNDKGIIVILDNRIRTKRYGEKFLNSIPKCRIILDV